jgi:hypothetical protein
MQMKKLLVALSVATMLSALVVGAAAAEGQRGVSPGLPREAASGAPPMTADVGFGYYLWFDGDRFQVRTTDRGNGPDPSIYTGRITTNGTLTRVDVFKDEEFDRALAGPRQIDFRFRTYNWQDGLAFRVEGGGWVTFRLYRNGHPIGTEHIFIGPGQVNPPTNPFAIIH